MNRPNELEKVQSVVAAGPVRTVVLLEDRAQVVRRLQVELPAGQVRVKVEAVTPLIADRTLVARPPPGVRVDEVKVRRRWRIGDAEKPPDARALAVEAKRLENGVAEKTLAHHAVGQRRKLLFQAARLLVDTVNRELPYATQFEPRWEADLEGAVKQVREVDARLFEAREQIKELNRELEGVKLRQGMSWTPSEVFDAELEVDVFVEKAGAYTLDVEYTVPCALWRPIHRATLQAQGLRFECEAAVWQNTGEDWTDVDLKFSTARSTQRAEPPLLSDDWLSIQRRQEKKVSVAIREQAIATTGEGAAKDAGLPGVDDGGETRLLDALVKTTVTSDGRMRRVPVFAFEAPAEVDRLACPELEPLVHLRARAANTGKHPILAGPVDLMRTSGYVGRSQIGFVAPGEKLALGFGTEDGLRVRRQAWGQEDRSRLTGKQTFTRFVELYLSNLDDAPASFTVQERIPVSEIDKVKIEIDAKESKPAAMADDQGIVTWKVTVMAHGTDKLRLVYVMTASSDVEGLRA